MNSYFHIFQYIEKNMSIAQCPQSMLLYIQIVFWGVLQTRFQNVQWTISFYLSLKAELGEVSPQRDPFFRNIFSGETVVGTVFSLFALWLSSVPSFATVLLVVSLSESILGLYVSAPNILFSVSAEILNVSCSRLLSLSGLFCPMICSLGFPIAIANTSWMWNPSPAWTFYNLHLMELTDLFINWAPLTFSRR